MQKMLCHFGKGTRYALFVSICWLASHCLAYAERAFEIDDLLANEQLGSVALSPSGDRVAAVVIRSLGDCRRTASVNSALFYDDHVPPDACGVIQVLSAEHDLTIAPPSDVKGFFGPQWSPSGRRLAFLSMDFEGEVHLWLWESGAPVRITKESIDLYLNVGAGSGWDFRPFGWSGEDSILLAVPVTPSSGALHTPTGHPSRTLAKAWAAQAAGVGSSSSEIRSRVAPNSLPKTRLVQIRLDNGNSVQEFGTGSFIAVRLSLSGNKAVVSEAITNLQLNGQTVFDSLNQNITPNGFQLGLSHSRIGVIDFESTAIRVQWLSGAYDLWTGRAPRTDLGIEVARFAGPQPVWSQGGSQVAFLGRRKPSVDAESHLFVYDFDSGNLHDSVDIGAVATALRWSEDQVVYAQPTVQRSFNDCSVVWCLVGSDLEAPSRNFLFTDHENGSTPAALFLVGGELWFVRDNTIYAANTHSGGIRKVFSPGPMQETTIVAIGPSNESVLIKLADRSRERYEFRSLSVDNHGLHEKSLYSGAGTAGQVRAFGGPAGLTVIVLSEEQGIEVVVVSGADTRPRVSVSLNEHLRDVSPVRTEIIEYQNRHGEHLSAVLTHASKRSDSLPIPLVVMVYPSAGFSSEARFKGVLNDRHFLSDAVLPSMGYAVLYPRITVDPPERDRTLCQQFADDVLPAISSLDSREDILTERVVVIGFSFGGYVVNSLMTCTDRFAGGISVAGFSDLFESYWRLPFPYRYTDHALNADFGFYRAERDSGGVFNLGATPWSNPHQYLDNSPIFRADMLSAPLLLLHGEFDAVSIAHSEKMLMAGRRLGKDVTLVRYWGAGHVLRSPDNIRDFWSRIFRFLEKIVEEEDKLPG